MYITIMTGVDLIKAFTWNAEHTHENSISLIIYYNSDMMVYCGKSHKLYRGLPPPPPPPLEKRAVILADGIFKCMFLNENGRVPNYISLKFVAGSLVHNKPALVQVMAWGRMGDKSLPEPMMAEFTDTYIRRYGEMSQKLSMSLHE